MKRAILIVILSLFCTLSACCYEYNSYYNNQSCSKKTQNDFSQYMENVKAKLKKNWIAPDFLEEGHVRVLFKLDREGNVIIGDILESSGNTLFDESVVHAIHRSEPFGAFPEQSPKQTLTINYSFDTTCVKTDKMKEYYELAKKYFYSDRKESLKYLNLAIAEVEGDDESYFLYKKRAKLKEAMGEHLSAKEDFEQYQKMKRKVDIKRVHALKYQVEIDDTAFAYYYLAFAYEQIKDYNNAIEAINRAIERTELNHHYKRYKADLIKKQNI